VIKTMMRMMKMPAQWRQHNSVHDADGDACAMHGNNRLAAAANIKENARDTYVNKTLDLKKLGRY
jgi:hypothetical protein